MGKTTKIAGLRNVSDCVHVIRDIYRLSTKDIFSGLKAYRCSSFCHHICDIKEQDTHKYEVSPPFDGESKSIEGGIDIQMKYLQGCMRVYICVNMCAKGK